MARRAILTYRYPHCVASEKLNVAWFTQVFIQAHHKGLVEMVQRPKRDFSRCHTASPEHWMALGLGDPQNHCDIEPQHPVTRANFFQPEFSEGSVKMVSFVCDRCNDVMTKPKTKNHRYTLSGFLLHTASNTYAGAEARRSIALTVIVLSHSKQYKPIISVLRRLRSGTASLRINAVRFFFGGFWLNFR